MKLGFDIDDTLINLREHAFNIYNKKLNKNVGIEEFHALDRLEIHAPFGLSEEEGKEIWKSSADEVYYTTCPAFPQAVETLNQLEAEGHEIYYITARPKDHEERTKQWMIEQGFPVREGRFFCGMDDHEKKEIIHDLAIDFYFDDKPAVLDTLDTKGSLRVYVKDQSYNRHLSIPRITNWTELPKILEKA